jgi:SSU ribosomal protein S9P
MEKFITGIGRRKKATAIVKLKEGKGEILINKKPLNLYFPLFYQQDEAIKPL